MSQTPLASTRPFVRFSDFNTPCVTEISTESPQYFAVESHYDEPGVQAAPVQVANSWSTSHYDTFKGQGENPYQGASSNPNVAWSTSNYDLESSEHPRLRAWTNESIPQSTTYETIARGGHYDILEQQPNYDALHEPSGYQAGSRSLGTYATLSNYDAAEASTDYDAADPRLPDYDRADPRSPDYERARASSAASSGARVRHDTVYKPPQSSSKPVLHLQDVYY